MLKSEAIEKLGGTPTAVASAIGITPQAVTGWPDELPKRIEDRVLAALYRQELAAALAAAGGNTPKRRKTDKAGR